MPLKHATPTADFAHALSTGERVRSAFRAPHSIDQTVPLLRDDVTMSAVIMPNMLISLSTCERMWQWKTQVPMPSPSLGQHRHTLIVAPTIMLAA
jgi:hypothetical protein